MNYATYKQFRDEVLGEKCPLRLDCMNPVQALADWAKRPEWDSLYQRARWGQLTHGREPHESFLIGRRLSSLLVFAISFQRRSLVQERNQELWLPEDVYPVYWELAKHTDVRARAFTTLPRPDWTFLAQTGECAAVLVPAPLSPVGRLPTDAEIDALFRWLRGSRRRLLIIDAVYTFDFSVGRALSDSLLADNQCLVLWSCSKSWLYPGVLGLAKVPASLAPGLRSRVSLPSDIEVGRVIAMLEGRPDLPRMQQEAFDREWRRLAPCLRSASPDWQPPATGYFSVVSAPFMRLLEEHGIVSVPATVFGSRRNDLSIVTCLHDLVANSAGNNFKI